METLPVLSVAAVDLAAMSDEWLMSAMQRAVDESVADELFSEIFRRYEPRVRAWCLRVTGDPGRAIDLSQEVFFKAFRHMHGFRGDAKFSTWLYAIAHNHCLNSLKRRSVAAAVELSEIPPGLLADAAALEPYAAVERRQSFRLMWQLISATLSALEARVLELHYGHEVPLADITEELALSNPSGAKAYIVSARRKLQKVLRQSALPLAG